MFEWSVNHEWKPNFVRFPLEVTSRAVSPHFQLNKLKNSAGVIANSFDGDLSVVMLRYLFLLRRQVKSRQSFLKCGAIQFEYLHNNLRKEMIWQKIFDFQSNFYFEINCLTLQFFSVFSSAFFLRESRMALNLLSSFELRQTVKKKERWKTRGRIYTYITSL